MPSKEIIDPLSDNDLEDVYPTPYENKAYGDRSRYVEGD